MNERKQAFVLLAGGGMSSWIWERVIPLLEYPSIAPAGRYEPADGDPPRSERTARIEDCARYVARILEESDVGDAILVAHSGAGILAPRVCEFTDAVRKIVFVAANIPPVGKSALDMLPFRLRLMNAAALLSMNKPMPMKKLEKTIREHFCNASDEATVEFVLAHDMKPEPRGIAFEKRMGADGTTIQSAFVRLLRDGTQSTEAQNRMAENFGTREFHDIDADHLVMLSAPERLAAVLNGIGREVFGRRS